MSFVAFVSVVLVVITGPVPHPDAACNVVTSNTKVDDAPEFIVPISQVNNGPASPIGLLHPDTFELVHPSNCILAGI